MSDRIITGDALTELRKLPGESVHCCVTSPPYYGLRDYGMAGQIGIEPSPDEYIAALVAVFREVRRVLRRDGTMFLNIGDSYSSGNRTSPQVAHGGLSGPANPQDGLRRCPPIEGIKPKDLIGIPWLVAFALRADGWYLRQDIIWSKPNPMPESVTDRCTKSHEYLFLLSRSERYFYDAAAIAENTDGDPDRRLRSSTFKKVQLIGHARSSAEYVETIGRNRRSVWTVATAPFSDWTETVRRLRVEPDAPDDGKKRITSPDCPLQDHGNAASNNAADVLSDNPNNQTDGDIAHTSPQPASFSASDSPRCTCEWYVEITEKTSHFATFPPALIEPCILAGCPRGGTVLDPFGGAGTTGLVADRLGRNAILIELNPEYAAMARRRIEDDAPLFAEVS